MVKRGDLDLYLPEHAVLVGLTDDRLVVVKHPHHLMGTGQSVRRLVWRGLRAGRDVLDEVKRRTVAPDAPA